MEEKYIPKMIHFYAGGYVAPMIFKTQTFEMNEEFYSKVVVFIEIMDSKGEGYKIVSEVNKPPVLIKRTRKGGNETIIIDPNALYNDRDLLGKVTLYYNSRIVDEFPSYEVFWKALPKRNSTV